MKFKSSNIAAAVTVALMLSGLMSSPALAAKKPAAIGVGYQVACSIPETVWCTVERNGRHGFVKNEAGKYVARRGTEVAPGVTIGSYATMQAGVKATQKHIDKYGD